METTSIVAILLFILPGVLAEKISYHMDYPSEGNRSDFRDIINGMLLSLPVLFIAGIISWAYLGFTTLKEFVDAFNGLRFLSKFSILVFVLAIILGIIKGLTKDIWIYIVNKVRKISGKMNIDDKPCWRKALLDENVSRYIKIIKDGIITNEGFALHYSLPNKEKEIVLDNPKNIEEYPEFKEYLRLCKTYVNIEKGVIVEVYDTEKLNEYFKGFENKTHGLISTMGAPPSPKLTPRPKK